SSPERGRPRRRVGVAESAMPAVRRVSSTAALMKLTADPSSFYVVGGTVPRDAPSYIDRRADAELLDALRKSQFCYVLTSRQMGKSSLMVRAAARLRQEGVAVA